MVGFRNTIFHFLSVSFCCKVQILPILSHIKKDQPTQFTPKFPLGLSCLEMPSRFLVQKFPLHPLPKNFLRGPLLGTPLQVLCLGNSPQVPFTQEIYWYPLKTLSLKIIAQIKVLEHYPIQGDPDIRKTSLKHLKSDVKLGVGGAGVLTRGPCLVPKQTPSEFF